MFPKLLKKNDNNILLLVILIFTNLIEINKNYKKVKDN